ncbi:hypothetical protein F5B20DRAFT_540807 [Whalleya microplaca]|nr:hypothetical protein F5B20DRAFT_540807 [Whalleya microplaca]
MTKYSRIPSLFSLSIWLLAGPVSCGSIAAWWNTRGPSLIMQDDDTGGIRYSLCNGNYTPVFPNDTTIIAPLTSHPPKKNTSLSATGWMDGETTWASIFYLDDSDEIVNTLMKCDWNTGRWENNGDYVISGGAPKVAPNTGLSVVLLGSTAGYRVFYNDLGGVLHYLGYTSDTQRWGYYGIVSNDKASSQAIGSTFITNNNNITVVRPRDGQNMGVSRWYSDHLWHIGSFPQTLTRNGSHATNATSSSDIQLNSGTAAFSLPAWDGNATSIAVGENSSDTRSVFYIGTDKKVYQVGNTNTSWSIFDRPDDKAWPQADVAGGQIGIASSANSNAMRLYYISGGNIVEANGDNQRWQDATVLPSFNASEPATSSPTTGDAIGSSDKSGSGLSDGAKAGISVGVTLGVVAISGMLAAFWFLRRRQRKLDEAAAAEGQQQPDMSPPAQPATYYSEMDSQVGSQYNGSAGGYAPQAGYAQSGYPQTGYAPTQDGYPQGVYPPQQGYSQDGWTYANYQSPQEMPDQRRPVEMMGEGHYKEAP